MITNYDCWCFDFDGTLIDIKNRYSKIHSEVITKLGGNPIQNYWQRRRKGNLEKDLYYETLTPKHMINVYDKHREKLIEELDYLKLDFLFPEVYTLLNYLTKSKRPVNLITHRSNRKNLNIQLKQLGLKNLLSKISNTKSNKIEFLNFGEQETIYASIAKSKELIKFKADFHTVMVGDSPTDIFAAKIAKVDSIAIPTGLYDSNCLKKLKPTFLIDSIKSLYQNLLTL